MQIREETPPGTGVGKDKASYCEFVKDSGSEHMVENPFLHCLQTKKYPVGTLVMSGSPQIAELLAVSGYDFLVLDTEHSLTSLPILQAQTIAVQSAGVVPIIRVPGHDEVMLKQILDVSGCETLMIPMVNTPEQARDIVSRCTYPPEGTRGFARFTRATRYTSIGDYRATASQRRGLVVQVETEEAIRNIVSIGRVPGITSVFLGLGDLSVAMGSRGLEDPEFKRFVEDAVRRCGEAGIRLGSFLFDESLISWFFRNGGTYVSMGADLKALLDDARRNIDAVRRAVR